ncbi:glycerophosphodiester phosphodiesterase GDPD4 isoform X1 [Rhododendron vialii]|uniref:glycerophosphodiester phosphodiesterase GDPD4 isoform X1 n=1 Tax=Rhododendron vialii TaxID=182163 RepID=UPI00265E4794|nr:glycerophosphodiester phosphodiesterase GDPD4 isoform X1 [Rhododendron vialii]
MAISSRLGRKQQRHVVGFWRRQNLRGFTSRKAFRLLLISLALIAIVPPIFFHFKLRRFHQMQLRKCGWLNSPPLLCAHGGDSSKAFPNTMTAYRAALHSQVDCIEIDVSRSSDGVLFALHDRDLQRISGNSTTKVGYWSVKQIKELDAINQFPLEFNGHIILTVEDALKFVSSSVKQLILDAKVGPPSYEKGLAKDILSVVERTKCKNCLVWAKSDNLARDVIKLSPDMTVGYIVMKDPSTGARNNLLRMRGAGVVGVYHPLIDDKLMTILHGYESYRRNKKVYAWTVDEVVSMKKMLYEHVDAVVTSNPTLLQQIMQDMETQCFEEGFSLSR